MDWMDALKDADGDWMDPLKEAHDADDDLGWMDAYKDADT